MFASKDRVMQLKAKLLIDGNSMMDCVDGMAGISILNMTLQDMNTVDLICCII